MFDSLEIEWNLITSIKTLYTSCLTDSRMTKNFLRTTEIKIKRNIQ